MGLVKFATFGAIGLVSIASFAGAEPEQRATAVQPKAQIVKVAATSTMPFDTSRLHRTWHERKCGGYIDLYSGIKNHKKLVHRIDESTQRTSVMHTDLSSNMGAIETYSTYLISISGSGDYFEIEREMEGEIILYKGEFLDDDTISINAAITYLDGGAHKLREPIIWKYCD